MRKSILQPGIKAPQFTLAPFNRTEKVNIGGDSPGASVLLFFGTGTADEIAGQLRGYQEKLPDYESRRISMIGITDLDLDSLKKLIEEKQMQFPIINSEQAREAALSYGVVVDNAIRPAVFVVDQEGLIRRIFHPEPAEGLPNPAMVLRAVNNLANTPKPPQATPDDWRLGAEEAPIVIIEYGDYQCWHCRDLYQVILELLPHYQNKVQFIFRHFPMRHAHPLSVPAAQAAEAAGLQGKFWEMHARLFKADNALERENLRQYAGEIGLDLEKFSADLEGNSAETAVMEDYHTATKHKVKSPPTLFINYILFDGSHTAENLRAKIDDLLACLD